MGWAWASQTDSSKVRPLACTNCIARFVGRLAILSVRDAANDYFLNSSDNVKQFAFAKGGTDACFAFIDAHLELNPSHVVAECDLECAFNMFDRAIIWEQLRKVPGLSGILPYVAAVYGVEATIVLERGDLGPLRIGNSVGGRQGCVLAMLLFCLAHHPAMLETAARHPGTRLVAFADDTKTCGNYDAVPAAIATYTGLYALETNGSINADKSGFYSPEVEELDVREAIADAGLPDDIAVSRDGVVVVGAPIGTAAFVTKFVKGEVTRKSKALKYVQAFKSVQNQHFFLLHSLAKNFVHLMRLVPCGAGSVAGSELAVWDTQLEGLLSSIVGGPLDDLSRGIAALSVRNGGLGLVPTAMLADTCLVAGKLAVAKVLGTCPPLAIAAASLTDLAAEPTYPTEIVVHEAISRIDELAPGSEIELERRVATSSSQMQRALAFKLADVRKHDLVAGQSVRTRALLRSNAGNPHVLAVPHNRSPAFDLSNSDFTTTIRRRLRLPLSPLDGANGAAVLCDGCNKLDCADIYGDSRLSCNAKASITRLVHDPLTERIASLARMNGLRATVEPAPANPHTSKRVDFTVRGLLGNGGVLYGDTVITTVTCKSHANDAAIVDGAAAAKAAAGKVGKHRDLVLAGNPDNRFVPFAVEEGGRLGTDAEALVDVMVRAGSADPTTWCATKTYCMRTLAVTTAKGIARVLQRRRLPRPRLPSNAPKPPTATSLAHLAHITTPLDCTNDAAVPVQLMAEGAFYSATTTSPMQSAAAMVGA